MFCVLLTPEEEPYRAFIEDVNHPDQKAHLVLVDYAERHEASICDLVRSRNRSTAGMIAVNIQVHMDARFLAHPVTTLHVWRDLSYTAVHLRLPLHSTTTSVCRVSASSFLARGSRWWCTGSRR